MKSANEWLRQGARVPQVDTMTTCEDFEEACYIAVEMELEAGRRLMLKMYAQEEVA